MVDAPEKIWIDSTRSVNGYTMVAGASVPHVDGGQEYVRADIAERQIAELRASTAPATADGWRDISEAPKDGTRFLAAEHDGDEWITGMCLWCKTPHVPIYGFHFTEGDPENWNIAHPSLWQPVALPAAPTTIKGV